MNTLLLLHFTAIGSGFILGLLVFLTNPKRRTNRVFFILTILLTAWMTCQAIGLTLSDTAIVMCIRLCMIIAVFIPLAVDWLQTTIIHPDRSWRDIWTGSRTWLLFSGVIAVMSGTHLFVTGATRHGDRLLAEPLYTLYFTIYAVYFITSLGLMLLHFVRNLRDATGAAKTELQFVMLGNATGFTVGVLINVILPVMTNNSHYALLTPLSVICLYVATGYGIATRRIMDVATVMRRLTAYVFLILFLAILYAAIWFALNASMSFLGIPFTVLPHYIASLVVAFSLAPSRGWMKRVTDHLFISFSTFDASQVVRSADALFRSVTSIDRLLPDFTALVTSTIGADSAVIVLRHQGQYVQRYPEPDAAPITLGLDDPLPVALATLEEAVVPDILRRLRLEPAMDAACKTVEKMKFAAAVGLFSQEGLEGLLLLPPRLSGRIYGAPEQQILQLLCNQLATAISSSRLYTQFQDSKVYNEILLDSLVSGVVAAGANRILNVFNREAQRITGLAAPTVLGHSLDRLPQPLDRLLTSTLEEGVEIVNQDHVLVMPGGDPIPLRVSSSVIFGHRGKRLGAFLVVSDLTAIKQLELQVRRTDRLASLGTLAAGMAHEIKNPLVSIKTFTQLLPERFDDADFRETFTSLMSEEVKRIDSIVNQLLRFSRPAKPVLSVLSLHELLTHTLKLLQQQMRPKNIELVTSFTANPDRINADGDQFSQALINFILNAIESMKQGGTLTVTSSRSPAAGIQITIQDTGEGISAENLPHIFDPFFTTKDQGTGLGLSVAHGIILEHGGSIDVTSEPDRGTTFTITLPPLEQEGART
jgi:PAS domain S-box-containing protein